MNELRKKKGFICDMDGVIYHGNHVLDGVKEFVDWLYRENKEFLFLTNSSEYSPRELQQKLARMGLEVSEDHFYTSALATAHFLSQQSPGCSEDSEPSVRTVISLINTIRREKIPVVFYIEFSSRRTADILAEETGAKELLFHSCHNVSADEMAAGATYLSLMKNNLEALKEALN